MSTKTKSPTKKYDFERAIEVKSKEELSFLMIEKSLEYLHHSTRYNHGHIIEYLPPTVYYTDSQGQVYKFIEQPKPIVNPFGKNRQTLESNIDSFSIIFKNLLASANENNENANRQILQAYDRIAKIKTILSKKFETEAEIESELDFLLVTIILESVTEFANKNQISSTEIINKLLANPKFKEQDDNLKFKHALEGVLCEIELSQNDNENELN